MELVIAVLIGIPAQVAVFAAMPFAWWLQAGRPDGSFLRWLGFRRAPARPDTATQFGLLFGGLGFFAGALLGGRPSWATSSSAAVWLVMAVILTAVLQAALSEELFFRGFLLQWLEQRLVPATGDATQRQAGQLRRWVQQRGLIGTVANAIQAGACGLLRMTVQWLLLDRSLTACLAALALGTGSAFLAGWVRQRTRSVLLPWAAHGAGNVVGTLIATLP